MATFNPDVKGAEAEPNYMHYSRQGGSDRSMEKLFEGIGSVGTQAANLFDEVNQRNAKSELQAAKGEADQGLLGDAPAPTQAPKVDASGNIIDVSLPASDGAPATTKGFQRDLQKGTAAYQSGRWSDAQYWTWLDAKTSQAKARYPGYSDVIDASIKQITGHVPADMAIKARFQEAANQQGAVEDDQKKLVDYVKAHPEAVQPDWWQRRASGNPYSGMETYAYGSKYIAQEHERNSQKQDILFSMTQRKDVTEQAARLHNQEVNQYTDKLLLDMADPYAKKFQEAKSVVDQQADKATPQEQEAVRQAWAQLEMHWNEGMRKINAAPFAGDSTKSYYTLVDQKDIAANEAQAKQRMDNIKESLTNGHWGILESTHRIMKAQEDSDVRALLDNNKALRLFKALKSAGADSAFNMRMNTDEPLRSQFADVAQIKNLGEAMTDPNAPGLKAAVQGVADYSKDQVAKGPGGKPVPGQDYDKMISNYTGAIKDKNTPNATFGNLVEYAFGPKNDGFLDMFKYKDREKVYSTMVSPEVTARVAEMSKSAPALWNKYRDFATKSFFGIFKADLDQAKDQAENTYLRVSFNPTSGQLEYQVNNPMGRQQGDAAGQSIKPTIDKLNRELKILGPIAKQDGKNAGEVVAELLQQHGVEFPDHPGGTLTQKVIAAMVAHVGTTAKELVKPKGEAMGFEAKDTGAWRAAQNAFADPLRDPTKNPYKPEEGPDTGGIDLTGSDVGGALDQHRPLMNLIRKAESSDNYGSVFGSSREYALENHTLDEVQKLQQFRKGAGYPSTATGGYQILGKTLEELKGQLGLSGSKKFTPELQDKLAYALLKRRGLDKYESGEITREEFAKELSKEFAGLPTQSGKSYYHGDGLNESTVKYQELLAAIDNISSDKYRRK